MGNDPVNHVDPSGLSCTQNGDKKGYTCKLDDPGTLKGKALDRANTVYTRAVNRLLQNPEKTVSVRIGDGQGNKGVLSGSTTRGEIAQVLINANAVYAKGNGNDYGTYNNGTLTMTDRGLNQNDRGTAVIFIHEGMYGTRMDAGLKNEVQNRMQFWQNDLQRRFNDAHGRNQSAFNMGHTDAAASAYDDDN